MRFPSLRVLRGQSQTRIRSGAEASVSSLSLHTSVAGLAPLAAIAAIGLVGRQQPAEAVEHDIVEPLALPAGQRQVDVVLSSGFLSFANHAGFLRAVEEAGLEPRGIMGTSAGALSGSLYAAGYSPERIAEELSRLPPIEYLKMSSAPWEGGVFNMDKVIDRYRELLPATFEDLPKEFAVGVFTRTGEYRVIDSGPLPEAVVASAAIPFVFENVAVPGVGPCMDGGKWDRVGLEGWQARAAVRAVEDTSCEGASIGKRSPQDNTPTLVHLISRSSPFSGNESIKTTSNVVVLRSPKSGVSLQSLGNFDVAFESAYRRCNTQLSERVKLVA